ncbi:hypothetical protein [Methanobrevibacter arboriphilus]|uniref:hypothetical protein n=1 Tax=Methanobrevibacter arboriphilus TaxID=39441 RepID=UPI000A9B0B1B|nr:hypothetical protein [Methanobrevibacter arboriphilus]
MTYKDGNKFIKRIKTVKISYKYKYLPNPYLSSTYGCNVKDSFIKKLAKKWIKGKNTKKSPSRCNTIKCTEKN